MERRRWATASPGVVALAIFAVSLAAVGCFEPAPFPCTSDDECTLRRVGSCEPEGWCAYASSDCESGRKFGPYAGSESDRCVERTPETLTFAAILAVCVGDASLDPALCQQHAGPNRLDIDLLDSDTGETNIAYVQFMVDDRIEGREIEGVRLVLTVASEDSAGADSTGQLVSVAPFDAVSLTQVVPAVVGTPLGLDQGVVMPGEEVVWEFTLDIGSGANVSLAILPQSVDNVQYWASGGGTPPRLEIDLR